jgi:translocator protein
MIASTGGMAVQTKGFTYCMQNRKYLFLIIWIVALVGIGSAIGSFTKPEMSTWYSTLHRSPLTPPNYVFPIAWTILYGAIGACGWLIWRTSPFPKLKIIKILYMTQLILNWSWTPLFFHYHLTGLALLLLGIMNMLVSMLIWLSYRKIKLVSLLLSPYLSWILFATYLSFYIWQNS